MIRKTNRCSALAVTLAAGLVLAAGGIARAEYPEKPITMLVGAGAGGSTDSGARILASSLEKSLGQPVIVVNKPGGGGTKAAVLLKKAKPDGYTISYAYSMHYTFGPHYKRKTPPYRLSDFTFVASVTDPRFSIVSLAGRGWTDFAGMMKKLRAEGKPLRLVYSGGPGRLIGTAIARELNYPVKIIRVRGGGKSMQRVLGGHVDVVYTGGAHTPYTEAGKTIVVASVDAERNPDYPNAKTLRDYGVNAATTGLQIVVAPKGIPKAVLDRLSAAVAKARKDPQIVKLYRKNLKMLMDDRGPKALVKYLRAEEANFKSLIAAYSD